jgi:hypothetical protein
MDASDCLVPAGRWRAEKVVMRAAIVAVALAPRVAGQR